MARQPKDGTFEALGAIAVEHVPPAAHESGGAKKKRNKADTVLALLARPDGATLDELVAATGWLPHSARAALTGLKKKGHAIERTAVDAVSRYAIVEPVSQ